LLGGGGKTKRDREGSKQLGLHGRARGRDEAHRGETNPSKGTV